MKPLAVITGVGPGTGSALVRRFDAGGYRVAMLARTADRLADLAREAPGAFAVPCDVTDGDRLGEALSRIEQEAGPPKVLIHNAVGGAFGSFIDIDPAVLERNFQVNVMALLHLARWAAPLMEAAGEGALIVTGNTSALRGRARFRADQGGPADPRRVDRARDGPQGRARGFPDDRCGDRSRVDPRALPRAARRLLHQAG
jgi:NAD(P)-dependent dehydrogenase (short-subunit alcohol dehydrogenase family)